MDLVLNVNGKPFTDHEAADQKARILSSELGEPYIVVDHPLGGYAVIRKAPPAPPPQARADSRYIPALDAVDIATSAAPPVSAAPSASGADITLRPSWLAFWKHNLLVVSGALIGFAPYWTLSLVFVGLLGVAPDSFDNHINPGLLRLVSGVGLFMILSAVSHMLLLRQSCLYRITPNRVETCLGILSRQTQRVDLRYIRSINVRQSFLDRLLSIGLVEFSSAAREGGDVIFSNVYDPRTIEEEVNRRMLLVHEQARGDE